MRKADVYRICWKARLDGRAGLLALVEVDGGDGTLADALRSELKFLFTVSNCKKKKKKSWNARNVQLTL